MLQECESKNEISSLRKEIKSDLDKAKNNKHHSYMRNHKYFKDGVLLPSQDQLYEEAMAMSIK